MSKVVVYFLNCKPVLQESRMKNKDVNDTASLTENLKASSFSEKKNRQ